MTDATTLPSLSPGQDFRRALLAVPALERDAWVNRALDLEQIPEDIELPRGCVPYLPAPVEAILGAVDELGINAADVVVDVGSGVGRAAALLYLLSGARLICVELQPRLLGASEALFQRLGETGVRHVLGDALEQREQLEAANVFFLYCPFSGPRLLSFLEGLRPLALKRELRFACVDVPLPELDWLEAGPVVGSLQIYRSR